MLQIEQNVEVSDTTGDDSSNAAGQPIKKSGKCQTRIIIRWSMID